MKKNKNTEQSVPPNTEKPVSPWARWLLIGALLTSCGSIATGLWAQVLEDRLSDLEKQEWYFIVNNQAISAEIAKRPVNHSQSNLSKMLRRVARPLLSETERKALINDERIYDAEVRRGLLMVVAATYLQSNDPAPETDIEAKFAGKSDDELQVILMKGQQDAWLWAKKLKDEMVGMERKADWWKLATMVLASIQVMMLAAGSLLLFAAGRMPGD